MYIYHICVHPAISLHMSTYIHTYKDTNLCIHACICLHAYGEGAPRMQPTSLHELCVGVEVCCSALQYVAVCCS